jgi:outer membrane protein assembly factor BamE (lipoprotein component of BamABCDE complex)
MKAFLAMLCVSAIVIFSGCAGVQAPRTDEILRQPLGSGGLSVGMTRTQVIEKYGQPDMKDTVSSPEWNSPREEWYYRARYSMLPVNVGYLADDLYLYFDGDNLTNISKRPLGFIPEEEDVVK